MERYATDLTLSLGFCFYFPLWLFFNFFLLPCTTMPASLQARGRRPRDRNKGSARREIRKLKYNLDEK